MAATAPHDVLPPARFLTRIPGLDTVLRGGFIQGDLYLIVGDPGTGKTTLANHLSYEHARAGGITLYVTLLAESHDRLLLLQRGFRFFDAEAVGKQVRYISALASLSSGGLDGLVDLVRREVRDHRASLLVIDGMSAAEHLAESGFELGRVTQRLRAHLDLLGCTTVLLSSGRTAEAGAAMTHVDGIVELFNVAADSQDVRELRVMKLRGSGYLSGRHRFRITDQGMVVSPRIEAAFSEVAPSTAVTGDRATFDVAGLDQILSGGLLRQTSSMVLGTPGAGKSVLGLHFLAAGVRRGERVVLATFQESPAMIVQTARGVGLPLAEAVDDGRLTILWDSPLELSPDAWAWRLLEHIESVGAQRLVVDAFSDLARLFRFPERLPSFLQALANVLRAHGVTSLFMLEIDILVGSDLVVPVPNMSAVTDTGIVLRTIEQQARLQRIISVLKMRNSAFDGSFRYVSIDGSGMQIGDVFNGGPGALTGVPGER